MDSYVVVDALADKLAEVEVLTLNETLAQKTAHPSSHSRSQASRGGKCDNWQNSHQGKGLSVVGTLSNMYAEKKKERLGNVQALLEEEVVLHKLA